MYLPSREHMIASHLRKVLNPKLSVFKKPPLPRCLMLARGKMSPLIRYEEAEVRKKLEEKERLEEQQQKKQDLKDDAKTSSEISSDPKGKNQLVNSATFFNPSDISALFHWGKKKNKQTSL